VGTLSRYVFALAALTVAAAHIVKPELVPIDVPTLTLLGVAVLLIFARGIRVKALELMGVKVEFDKVEAPATATVTEPVQTLDQKLSPRVDGSSKLSPDNFPMRLVKLTPIDTITQYAMLIVFIEYALTKTREVPVVLWIAFAMYVVATPIYYLKSLGQTNRAALWQAAFAEIIFCGWALVLGGPFKYLSWYDPIYGTSLLAAGTFLFPAVYPSVAAVAVQKS